ncbi:hypothetical protein BG004_000995 [Podila humilis]|nr:hypothetical protein BG004_000995 [Podila humilis]
MVPDSAPLLHPPQTKASSTLPPLPGYRSTTKTVSKQKEMDTDTDMDMDTIPASRTVHAFDSSSSMNLLLRDHTSLTTLVIDTSMSQYSSTSSSSSLSSSLTYTFSNTTTPATASTIHTIPTSTVNTTATTNSPATAYPPSPFSKNGCIVSSSVSPNTNNNNNNNNNNNININNNTNNNTMGRDTCLSPEPNNKKVEAEQDMIWQVLVDLSRVVLEAKKDHQLLAAEIEDLMATLESHCQLLGLDPANITHLCIPPLLAPITLTTRQALHRACDDMYKDILWRKDGIDRWISRITIIAGNIHEPPGVYLESSMPPISRARILELERTYRTLEKEWLERLDRFQEMVGLLRIRWDQCAYLPNDDYDWALNRLFEFAELQDTPTPPTALSLNMDVSLLRIEPPLCLSKACLAKLEIKLSDLNQNYYTRQSRIKAMEHVLGLIYQDLGTHTDRQVLFRNEATVKYAAELGRELKALQIELASRKEYLSGQWWMELATVWDTCLVSKEERDEFKSNLESEDITFARKMEKIRLEAETCHVRFSRCEAVYKLMMTRSNHIERMIAFEHTASDKKRLFQPSFQLVQEEKFRRRAYPALIKLETTLIETLERYEQEHDDIFMYEGAPYLPTLQAEIDNRHVNETVFAKFTPIIATPTRSQTALIMGRPISPDKAATITTTSSTASSRPTTTRHSTYVSKVQVDSSSSLPSRRSLTIPRQDATSTNSSSKQTASSSSSSSSTATAHSVLGPGLELNAVRRAGDNQEDMSRTATKPTMRSASRPRSFRSNSTTTASMGTMGPIKSKNAVSPLTGPHLSSLSASLSCSRNSYPYMSTSSSSLSRGSSSPASSTSNDAPLQTAAVAALGLLLAAMLKYPDRALFTTARKDLGKKRLKGAPLLGNLPDMIKTADDTLGGMLAWFEEHGDILSITVPIRGRFIFINHPMYLEHMFKNNFDNYIKGSIFSEQLEDVLHKGIFTSDGAAWRFHRKTSVNLFTTKMLRQSVQGPFQDTALALCRLLEQTMVNTKGTKEEQEKELAGTATATTGVDLQQLLLKLTLDSSGKVIFGIDFNTLSAPIGAPPHEFGLAFDYISANVDSRILNPFWHWTDPLTPGKVAKVKGAIAVLDKYAYEAIDKRLEERARLNLDNTEDSKGSDDDTIEQQQHQQQQRPRDLLDHFVNYTNPDDGSKLSRDFLRDVFVSFMFAGRDTTALAMTWMFYCIISQPRVLRNVRREMDRVLGRKYDRSRYRYEVFMTELPYLRAVFHETLRLYPQTPRNIRVAVDDDVMPDGTKVCAGDLIAFSLWTMGRNRDVWGHDAALFVPERWLEEEEEVEEQEGDDKDKDREAKDKIPNVSKNNNKSKSPFGKFRMESQFKFNSFNANPRLCLGQTFAILESMVTVCVVLQQYDVELIKGHPIPVPKGAVSLPMLHGLLVTASHRKV